jgi:hypothetical protein
MTRRPVLVGALAWVSVVTVASGITWVVIDSAGQQALFDAGGLPPLPAVSRTPAGGRAGSEGPSPQPSAPAQSSSARPDRSSTPTYRERTWQGEAGIVVARCSGAVIALQSATPSDDYRVELGSRGPQEVEVTFAGEGGQVKVRAECVAGVPSFSQEGESSDE